MSKIYGLIGEKLGHSFSKQIHEKLADYEYRLIPLTAEEFPEFMKAKEFKAINVTIPYKQAVIPYLDQLDEAATAIGAVNTIVNEDGILKGYNTDFFGFDYMLKKNGVTLEDKKVIILGTGATSKTVAAVCEEHFSEDVIKVSRNNPEYLDYEYVLKTTNAAIIINTTPQGMYPNNHIQPLPLDRFDRLEAVIDVIYNPLRTRLVLAAQEHGVPKAFGGLRMLVAQAKAAVCLFTGERIPHYVIDEVYDELMAEEQNIVLLAMPSGGKSTIGRELADAMGKTFVDLDQEIVKRAGKEIPAIFRDEGEDYFRQLEKDVVRSFSGAHNQVIATGGGVIKDYENIRALRQNGELVFLDRSPDKLIADDSRPLSSSPDAVRELYAERLPLYQEYSGHTVDNNGTIAQTVEQIQRLFAIEE